MRPARVVVLGAGNIGWNSAWIAQGMEAEVLLLDKNLDRLRWVDQIHQGRIVTLASNRGAVDRAVADADLVIGAVLYRPVALRCVVTDDMVRTMKPARSSSTSRSTRVAASDDRTRRPHSDPVYEVTACSHYAVGNMPGAVPFTSTYALTNATLPYALNLAVHGVAAATQAARASQRGQHRGRRGDAHDRGRGPERAVRRTRGGTGLVTKEQPRDGGADRGDSVGPTAGGSCAIPSWWWRSRGHDGPMNGSERNFAVPNVRERSDVAETGNSGRQAPGGASLS